jgi:UDP-3-O-[3-hydroxymyristoyl] glucosamine N-acyltransferase
VSVYVHPQGICESRNVGPGTRVWAFAHVLPGASVGEDCNICDHVLIENVVRIGDRVTIKSGVQLWDGVCLENDVFVGPNATLTTDIPEARYVHRNFSTQPSVAGHRSAPMQRSCRESPSAKARLSLPGAW